MAKKQIFVSFDYENDRHYKNLLLAWDANKKFDLLFSDASSHEINSINHSRVKAALTTRINSATHTLVIIGKEANKRHKDFVLIGYRNWINFETAKSKEAKNKIIAVKLNREFESPEEILNVNASWAMSFTSDAIVKAIDSV